VFLYTGRRACSLPIPPKFFYHRDNAGVEKLMASMADFARGYGLGYLLLTPDDYHRDLHEMGTRGLTEAMRSPSFRQVYASKGAAIYKLNPAPGVQPAGGSLAYNHSK
jgi:hypothetical protein